MSDASLQIQKNTFTNWANLHVCLMVVSPFWH
jgi:hypothetical protein